MQATKPGHTWKKKKKTTLNYWYYCESLKQRRL